MKPSYKRIAITLTFVFAFLTGEAQYQLSESEHLILKYPNSSQVLLSQKETYTIKKLKTGELDIRLRTIRDVLITKAGTFDSNSEELRSDSSFMELVKFDAYSLIPVKGKYKKQKVKKVFKNDEFEQSLFTNDTKTTQFYFPSTDAKVITHLDYELKVKDPRFLPPTFLKSFRPIENLELKIITDNDVTLDFLFYNMDESELTATKTVGKSTTEYVWKNSEVPEMKYHGGAPNVKWYLPHVIFKIEGYETEEGYKTVLGDLNDLYSLYQGWVSEIEPEDSSKMSVVLDEILEGAETDLEKLKRIYEWVQLNIKYIAFTDGKEGFVPRSAQNVMSCRFGDCKGMTNLMFNMAKVANVETHRTWIGSRDIPYTYEEVATPFVDNHMILSYLFEDSVIFMDATSSETPFGYPTEFIQGKQALIALDTKDYQLSYVPVVSGLRNSVTDSVYVSINGADLVGKGNASLSGYHSVRWQSRVKRLDEKEKQELVESYFEKGDNRFSIKSFTDNVSPHGDRVDVAYDFRIPNYVVRNEDELYINLNLSISFGNDPIDEDREIPVELSFNSSTHDVVVLELGEDFTVEHLPESSGYVGDTFGYSMDYSVRDNKVIFSLSSFSKDLIMYPEAFESWNELSTQFRKDIRKNLVLKKK